MGKRSEKNENVSIKMIKEKRRVIALTVCCQCEHKIRKEKERAQE